VLTVLHKHAEAILGEAVRLRRDVAHNIKSTEIRLLEISTQLQKKGWFLKNLYVNMVDELITVEEFVAMKDAYNAQILALSQEADEIRDDMRQRESSSIVARDMAGAISQMLTEKELTADIVGKLVERILVSCDKSFDVRFCFEDEFGEVQSVG